MGEPFEIREEAGGVRILSGMKVDGERVSTFLAVPSA